MKKQDYIKEIRRLENRMKKSMRSMYTEAYLKNALPILKGTEVWQLMNTLFRFDITKGWISITKGVGSMNLKQLQEYYDKLVALDMQPKSIAKEMNKFVAKEKSRANKLQKEIDKKGISWDVMDAYAPESDWTDYLHYYIIPSEFFAEVEWLSIPEKITVLIEYLAEQEEVTPDQAERDFASKHVFTKPEYDLVIKEAQIKRRTVR